MRALLPQLREQTVVMELELVIFVGAVIIRILFISVLLRVILQMGTVRLMETPQDQFVWMVGPQDLVVVMLAVQFKYLKIKEFLFN